MIAPILLPQYTQTRNVADDNDKENVVQQNSAKLFSQRLNDCLDQTDAPASIRERTSILSKVLAIPKQQAFSLLEGNQFPSKEMLEKIATEFEVDIKWLAGDL